MRIVEQVFRVPQRMEVITTQYDTAQLFQVFVKGRLQDPGTYRVGDGCVDFGYDCLNPGDVVQLFYLVP